MQRTRLNKQYLLIHQVQLVRCIAHTFCMLQIVSRAARPNSPSAPSSDSREVGKSSECCARIVLCVANVRNWCCISSKTAAKMPAFQELSNLVKGFGMEPLHLALALVAGFVVIAIGALVAISSVRWPRCTTFLHVACESFASSMWLLCAATSDSSRHRHLLLPGQVLRWIPPFDWRYADLAHVAVLAWRVQLLCAMMLCRIRSFGNPKRPSIHHHQ